MLSGMGGERSNQIMQAMPKYPTLRSLKKGTKFYIYGKDDKKIVAIAGTKRSRTSRDITIEGQEGDFSMGSYNTVELVNS